MGIQDDLDENDELLKQAILEHRRKVFLKKLLIMVALVALLGVIVCQGITQESFQVQATVESSSN